MGKDLAPKCAARDGRISIIVAFACKKLAASGIIRPRLMARHFGRMRFSNSQSVHADHPMRGNNDETHFVRPLLQPGIELTV